MLLLLLKKARVIARTAGYPNHPLANLLRALMGEAAPGVDWPRYENPHQAEGRPQRRLLLLPLLAQADAPLPGQLGFQDVASEGFFGISQLHHSIWGWIWFVLMLVGLMLLLTVICFGFYRLYFALLWVKQRLWLVVDHQLEFS